MPLGLTIVKVLSYLPSVFDAIVGGLRRRTTSDKRGAEYAIEPTLSKRCPFGCCQTGLKHA